MTIRRRHAIVGAVVLALAAAGIAYATIPDDGKVFTACMLKNVGTVRLIDPSLPTTSPMQHCSSLEMQVSWNQRGQDGAPGAAGPAGAVGPIGPAGPAGKDGVDGKDGAPGSDGATGPQGPEGPAGPAGPQGPPGSGASVAAYQFSNDSSIALPGEIAPTVAHLTLPAGTYLVSGRVLIQHFELGALSSTRDAFCGLVVDNAPPLIVPLNAETLDESRLVESTSLGFVTNGMSLLGVYTSDGQAQSPHGVDLRCVGQGQGNPADVTAVGRKLQAIKVTTISNQ